MAVLDVEAFGALGKSLPGVLTIVDSTFSSPFLLQPIKYGVDIVIHSWYVRRVCGRIVWSWVETKSANEEKKGQQSYILQRNFAQAGQNM